MPADHDNATALDPEGALLFQRPWDRFADRFLAPDTREGMGHLWARFIFLRGLGLIFFSAFYSLAFQIHGLIGPRGILPAEGYLPLVARAYPTLARFWYAPTLLWLGAGDRALTTIVALGLVSSLLLTVNVWPRMSAALCVVFFLSFIAAGQEFANYQSDGMLLEAGFLSIWFAPRGLWPGLGARYPASRLSLFLLRWEWFRIYFESGLVKLMSGDVQWRELTAMDHYYEYGPLPTWIGWYAQHLPHWFHAATALFTLVVELLVVWMMFLPRRFKIALFCVLTPMQVGIILTANYAFLNYIVLLLGVLLVDDRAFSRLRLRAPKATPAKVARWRAWASGAVLGWMLYATCVVFFGRRTFSALVLTPSTLLAPFRFANAYGLFAVMTTARYELEFQGSRDGGATWTTYPFKYKPQDPAAAPGIYAPYQPRFEWDLWFASLGNWQSNEWVVQTETQLLSSDTSVLSLFARDPFQGSPPTKVRVLAWQYWFTDARSKRATGMWWRRQELGVYAPMVERFPDGTLRYSGGP